jgi:hypothetical protein
MTETLATKQAEGMGIRLASLPELPDINGIADDIFSDAMAFCARKIGVDRLEAVSDLLRQNDKTACGYCFYGLAKRVAASLGVMDENVRAVYVHDYDATPEDLCFGTLHQGAPLVHLIIWTERKTAALDSLIAALDRALARTYADLLDRPRIKGLLDAQMIDGVDIENRTGHGALLQAVHHRPIQVWER